MTTEMTNTEMTTFLHNARYMTAATRRAETLFADGYTAIEVFPGVFGVSKPDTTDEIGWPAYGGGYGVICQPDYHSCTCPAFAQWGECKHHLAVAREMELAASLNAQAALIDNAETATGCDAYARY